MHNGKNKLPIDDRVSKAEGISRDIIQILGGTFFGDHHIEAAKLLRNSMVMSVLTNNLEVAYNFTKAEMKRLDKTDLALLRRFLGCSSKVSSSIHLLDLGLLSSCFFSIYLQKKTHQLVRKYFFSKWKPQWSEIGLIM